MAKQREGFTLIEVAMYIALLVILGVPLVSIVLAGTRATSENDVMSKIEERNRIAVFRVEREVRKAIAGSTVLSNGGKTLQFTSAAGFDGLNVIPGSVVAFKLRTASDESLNGKDDNRNGVADEGELMWSDGTGDTVVCGEIDLNASSFALNGTGVTITIVSYGSLRGNGIFSLSKTMTVFPRN